MEALSLLLLLEFSCLRLLFLRLRSLASPASNSFLYSLLHLRQSKANGKKGKREKRKEIERREEIERKTEEKREQEKKDKDRDREEGV